MATKPFKHQRNYAVELRIADGPWYLAGPVCESRKEAESIGAMFAKWWLGVAESRAVPLKREKSAQEESIAAQMKAYSDEYQARRATRKSRVVSHKPCATTSHLRLISALKQREDDLIDRAEMDREYRENMWRNHDCDPAESLEGGMTFEEAMQDRYERENAVV